MSEFKCLGRVLDESGTNVTEYRRKVATERKVAGAISSVVNCISVRGFFIRHC